MNNTMDIKLTEFFNSIKDSVCIDCNKKIDKRSKRCRSCSNKLIHNKKIRNQKYCIECHHKISYNAIRCYSCETKRKWKVNIFKGHSQIKKEHKCPICNKEIKRYNSKLCQICYHKNRKVVSNFKRFCYKRIYFKSSYEFKHAKWLDKNKIKWLYESKTFDLGHYSYRPDFYLLEHNMYIEIKGYWRVDAKKKFNLFKKLYPKEKIKILYKQDLIKLGVL